jgi:hypothetical protein
MNGRRVYPRESDGHLYLQPGDYGKDNDGMWYVRPPRGHGGHLDGHTVTEHEDGTITVSPSILDPEPGGWHGYLEHGVWREI